MDTTVKIAIYVSAALVGAGVGYLVAQKLVHDDFEEIVSEEDAEEIEISDDEPPASFELEEEETPKENKNGHAMKPRDYSSIIVPNKKRVDLRDLVRRYDPSENDEPEKSDPVIFVIGLEEFATPSKMTRTTITYYEDDDTVADSDNDIIPNPENLIGPDGLLKFGDRSDDPDTVYIRNVKSGTDYEVIRIHDSYQQAILGITPEPKEKKPRGRKRMVRKDDEDEEGGE